MKNKNKEALELSGEILKNIELIEVPLAAIVTKSIRLARLRGDFEAVEWLTHELSGYPSTPDGIPPKEWSIGAKSGRHYQQKDATGVVKVYMHYQSVGALEQEIESCKSQLQVSYDPSVSISTANPNQLIFPNSNNQERQTLRGRITNATSALDKIKATIYLYILNTYYEMKFGDITESVFEKTRARVDRLLNSIAPSAIKELVSAYQNLDSESDSDWANAANSCRRVLKELADVLFPATTDKDGGVKLTEDAYVNRIIAFVESKSQSEKFNMIVGSHLRFIGERLDAVSESAAKGLHNIISKEDTERLVIYTYLLIGDVLSLFEDEEKNALVEDGLEFKNEKHMFTEEKLTEVKTVK